MRKTLTYKVTTKGRDHGKQFLITELSAAAAEEWAIRAFLAMASSGVDIPDEVSAMGFAGVASAAFDSLGKIPYEKAKPLLDEMMGCVQIIPDPGRPNVVRALIDDDIEEIATRFNLRREVLALHTDFFKSAAQ